MLPVVGSAASIASQPGLLSAHPPIAIEPARASRNIVYFDLETQKSADEVGGWDKISQMRMSIGVTYSSVRREYRIFGEKQVDDLLTELQRADLVVGFNNLRFDYEVLS